MAKKEKLTNEEKFLELRKSNFLPGSKWMQYSMLGLLGMIGIGILLAIVVDPKWMLLALANAIFFFGLIMGSRLTVAKLKKYKALAFGKVNVAEADPIFLEAYRKYNGYLFARLQEKFPSLVCTDSDLWGNCLWGEFAICEGEHTVAFRVEFNKDSARFCIADFAAEYAYRDYTPCNVAKDGDFTDESIAQTKGCICHAMLQDMVSELQKTFSV